MEPKVSSVSNSLSNAGINKDPDTSYHVEGFYQFKLSDNISITPGVIWLTGLRQKLSPNEAQTCFISGEHVTIYS